MPKAKPKRQTRQTEAERVRAFIQERVLPANDSAAREVRRALLSEVLAGIERAEGGLIGSALGRVVSLEFQGGVANGINHAAASRDRQLVQSERWHTAKAAATPEGWTALKMLAAMQSPSAICRAVTGRDKVRTKDVDKLARLIVETINEIATAWAERPRRAA
jgi:hypothetical protein